MMIRSQVAKEAALTAGKAVRAAIPTAGIIQKEGRGNIVTAADLASEKQIMEMIQTNFPDDVILSEETESNLQDVLSIEHLWVIDPIDGTSNFRYQRNYSCISIAYYEKGVAQVGAIYDPFRDELFFAEKDHGAFINAKKISVGNQQELGKATVATDNSYNPAGTKRNLELMLNLDPMPWILMKGSAVLTVCEVAAGRIDMYVHTAMKPWDNAAAHLIAQEAGSKVVGLKGEEISFLSPDIIVGNPTLVNQCVESLNKN